MAEPLHTTRSVAAEVAGAGDVLVRRSHFLREKGEADVADILYALGRSMTGTGMVITAYADGHEFAQDQIQLAASDARKATAITDAEYAKWVAEQQAAKDAEVAAKAAELDRLSGAEGGDDDADDAGDAGGEE